MNFTKKRTSVEKSIPTGWLVFHYCYMNCFWIVIVIVLGLDMEWECRVCPCCPTQIASHLSY